MDFRKAKRLHFELDSELRRLSEALTRKYGREVIVTVTGDGLCVMFLDQDMTGVGLDWFEQLAKRADFDIWKIETFL